jgi:LacI family transcriptional regulator
MAVRRTTQADVAKLARVSQAAVSKVLNGNDLAIPEQTRQRILGAMDELGYLPNKSAQSLRTQKTRTIASIIPDITNPFYSTFQRGIQSVTNQHDYDLIVYDTNENRETELRSLRSLERASVDGAILFLFHHGFEELKRLVNQGVPAVIVRGRPLVGEVHRLDTIYIENVAFAKTAVSHLIDKGHARIGLLTGLKDSPPQLNRLRGYQQALEGANLPINEQFIQSTDFTMDGGYQGMKKLLEKSVRPTAVFAGNDLMAQGAMLAIREAGLRIPEDMALVGIDDIPVSRLLDPPLTTVSQQQENIGRQAAEMIFDRINETTSEGPRLVEMPFELIVRKST